MRKIMFLGIALIISFTAIAGSIAFFTDSVTVDDNVITAGSIDVEQYEQERVKNEDGAYVMNEDGTTHKLAQFSQKQNLYPCVIGTNKIPVQVGDHSVQMYDHTVQNFMDKIVTAQNVGSSPAYIRTFVAVPAAVDGHDWIHLERNDGIDASEQAAWVWERPEALNDVEIDGAKYDIYVATYLPILPAGDTTPPSLLGFYMDGRISNDNDQLVFVDENSVKHPIGDHPSLSILVATEAAQTLPFTDANDALTQTFGDVDTGHHPWVK